MLSGVLRSKRAVTVNIEIMRAFVELRRAATSYAAIERRLEELERETGAKLGQHDEQLSQIFKALRHLISPPLRSKRPVGFRLPEDEGSRGYAAASRYARRSPGLVMGGHLDMIAPSSQTPRASRPPRLSPVLGV